MSHGARIAATINLMRYADLSAPTSEVECERNGGDWRLRRAPGQKELNGPMPTREQEQTSPAKEDDDCVAATENGVDASEGPIARAEALTRDQRFEHAGSETMDDLEATVAATHLSATPDAEPPEVMPSEVIQPDEEDSTHLQTQTQEASKKSSDESDTSTSDSEGWITPSNLHKHQHTSPQSNPAPNSKKPPSTLQTALLTTDFAMQNVALQVNLNVLSPALTRIRHLRTYILRCHACFCTVKEMSRQFCPRCGKPSLTRVACSTDANTGEFKLHLKKNMQWNTRGDRYSVPKPVSGSSNGKVGGGGSGGGGGKGGWGWDLILVEDQKEYQRAVGRKGAKERDLMSADFLPGILTGHRASGGGRPTVGAGRNVNAKRRR